MEEFQKYFFDTAFHHHWNAKISPIFHFYQENNSWICHICHIQQSEFQIFTRVFATLWCEFGYRPLKNVWVVMLFLKPKRFSKKTCNVLLLLCKCAVQKTSFEFVIAWFNFHMCNNISSIVEFQRWCVLKSMFFFYQESTYYSRMKWQKKSQPKTWFRE